MTKLANEYDVIGANETPARSQAQGSGGSITVAAGALPAGAVVGKLQLLMTNLGTGALGAAMSPPLLCQTAMTSLH